MPKNIVLLSDGTGNSASKLLKTNVWRIYESLDLHDPTAQVACYDDGVGTSSFKPLAILGGVFGVGLARNVLRLYRFTCEHYEDGDRIYAFGFSRGAFTIRVLIGLICKQGIIKTRPPVVGPSVRLGPPGGGASLEGALPGDGDAVFGSTLARLARSAYREYRRGFTQRFGLVGLGRGLRDAVVRGWEWVRSRKHYDPSRNRQVAEIAFVGLWDTVDAYGLPVDELTDGVDRWVWPLSMQNFRLSDKVRKACHVLALDDERNTFHPVLWDESHESQGHTHVDQERISQVWFAGMHSNVGGGYPDDALSCVSFRWMAGQARRHGLLFLDEMLVHHGAKADPVGRIYDSRSGLKSYYRYNPRRIEWLTNGLAHERAYFRKGWRNPTVTVARPKVHHSVVQRIAAAPEAYAPIVLPQEYAVVMEDGEILAGDTHPFESALQRTARAREQEKAWDLVWWKRAVYFLMVGVSLVLAIMPFLPWAERSPEEGALARAVLSAGGLRPSFASPWVRYYAANPWWLLGGLATLFALSRIGSILQASICGTMRRIYLDVTAAPETGLSAMKGPRGALYRLRSHPAYQGAFARLRRGVLPNVFGALILASLGFVACRIPFELASAAGVLCKGGASHPLDLNAASQPIPFQSSDLCEATGVYLNAGARYRIDLALATPGVWHDKDIAAPFPRGFRGGWRKLGWRRPIFILATPLRRELSGNWFRPFARVGRTGIEHHRLPAKTNEITALTSGELFLFVNDLIPPLGLCPWAMGWDACYKNNHGTATVTVRKIANALDSAKENR
jgi:hypothetical protein